MFKEQVKALLEAAMEVREDLFVLDFSVSGDQSIKVVLDGDRGVNLNDCIEVSRAIEHQLDRDNSDFSLEVTSAGATTPLEQPRQYHKHLGRTLQVDLEEEQITGTLTEVGATQIALEWKTREPKPLGKGKHTVRKRREIAFPDVLKAKVVLKF
ncbi:MAG: ribosome assembly cofactor RimP [Bacteroidota bacterium]